MWKGSSKIKDPEILTESGTNTKDWFRSYKELPVET